MSLKYAHRLAAGDFSRIINAAVWRQDFIFLGKPDFVLYKSMRPTYSIDNNLSVT